MHPCPASNREAGVGLGTCPGSPLSGGILGFKALLCKHYIFLGCPELVFICAPHPESVARMRPTAPVSIRVGSPWCPETALVPMETSAAVNFPDPTVQALRDTCQTGLTRPSQGPHHSPLPS